MRAAMASDKWARPKPGAHGLRRGAWYPVVNEMGSTAMIVLDVQKNNVAVPRDMLVLSEVRPSMWTVVEWQDTQRGAQRAIEENHGLTYVVCPACQSRADMAPADTPHLRCAHCNGAYTVDWENVG